MSKPIVSARAISKQYFLGAQQKHDLLRDRLAQGFRNLFRKDEDQGETRDFWALKDVSFDVTEGEVVGIVGRNGAGKSTLLKVLSQITEPTEGEVRIRGRVASLLEVGTGFHPELTGRENIYLNGAILGMSRAEIRKKFDQIVDFSEVEAFIDTPVKRYSSGMYVRLAFAVAAHLEPEILVVDEVLAVGDLAFRKKCMGKMDEVAKGGRTVFFVSHNMSAVQLLCTRGLLLKSGNLELDGPAKSVVTGYMSNFAATSADIIDLDGFARKGSGRARLKTLQIRPTDREGNRLQVARTGCNLELVIGLEACKAVESMNVAVLVYDSSGYHLMDVNTALKGQFLNLAAGESKVVRFTIQDLLLNEGTYFLTLWLGVGGLEHIDHIEFAASFDMALDYSFSAHSEVYPGTYMCRFNAQVS